MRLRSLAAAAVLVPALSLGVLPAAAQTPQAPVVTSTSGAFLAAQAAAARNDIGTAAWYYSYVLQRDPANTQLANLVFQMWLDVGNISAAAPIAGLLVDIDPGYEPARLVLATQALRTGQYEAARNHLAAVGGDPVSTLVIGLVNGWIDFALGDVDGALDAIEALDGQEWYPPFKAYHSALIADAAGRAGVALYYARLAYDLDRSLGPTQLYASLLARSGDTEGAVAALQAFLDVVPNQPVVQAQLAAIEAGEFGGPLVTDARAGAAQVFYDIATAIGDDGGQTTVPYLQLARRLMPDSSLTAFALADILQNLSRDEEAVDILDGIPVGDPLHIVAVTSAAGSLAALGEFDQAIARLEPLVAADPGNATVALTLANLYRSQERFDDTVTVLTPVIDAIAEPAPEDWLLYFVRGIGYERTDRFDLSVADMQEALELSPDEPNVLNYLGYSWIDRGENEDEAMAMVQRAVELQPDAGYIVDSLGWAYFRTGQYELAVETLERAAELTPDHAEIHEHLGDAYWQVGRRLEANFQWNHALDYEPTDEQRARLADKILNGLPD